MSKALHTILVALCLAAGFRPVAQAALPDPVAFGVAIELGNLDAARRWLDEGLDPNAQADRIGSGLMIGAWEGNIPMMALFHARGADLALRNRLGEQALQLAAWRGHVDAVRWLLDRGAPVDPGGKAWSALHYAVFAGHEEIARLLLARGGDANARAPNDATALMMAAREGRETLAQVLIDAGADPRLQSDRGETALTWAMRNGNFRIARLVSSAETFAEAVKAPPETFGEPVKSEPAPPEISELLAQLRRAEAAGEPTAALQQALMAAIQRHRQESTRVELKGKPVAKGRKPRLVITASRKSGGERAEVVLAATPAQRPADYDEGRLGELTELMRRLDEAEKARQPTTELRRAVKEAYERLKRPL